MNNSQLKNIGIIGYPLGHSLSPDMHNYVYNALDINARYNKWEVSELDLKNEFTRITNENFIGANVTVPYKEKIIPFLDELDNDSKITGAVNTILKQNGKLLGFNTDIYGIKECLNKKFADNDIDNVVLFGSGGAAKAVMYALLQRGLKNISIINRTELNTKQMLDNFKKFKFNSEYLKHPIGKFDTPQSNICKFGQDGAIIIAFLLLLRFINVFDSSNVILVKK